MSPRLRNTVVKLAAADAMRRSLISARIKPPPAATPLIAQITGFGTCSR